MNYKKLLKQTLLGIGTVATASNTVLAISFLDQNPNFLEVRRAIVRGQDHIALQQLIQAGDPNPNQTIQDFRINNVFDRFFCTDNLLWERATIYAKNIRHFYGINFTDFADSDSSNSNDNIFENSEILNFYLPFVEDRPESLLTLFTALEDINFMNHGATIWLPHYCNIPDLRNLIMDIMEELHQEDDDYVRIAPNNLDAIINMVRFYTEDQLDIIYDQYEQFYSLVTNNHLQDYLQYINCNVKPQELPQQKWMDYVLPLKNAALALSRTMDPMQVIPPVQGNR